MLTLSTVDSSSVYSCRRTKVLRDPHPPQTSPEIGKPWVVWAVHVCKRAASATGVAKPIPASPPATAITSDKGKGRCRVMLASSSCRWSLHIRRFGRVGVEREGTRLRLGPAAAADPRPDGIAVVRDAECDPGSCSEARRARAPHEHAQPSGARGNGLSRAAGGGEGELSRRPPATHVARAAAAAGLRRGARAAG